MQRHEQHDPGPHKPDPKDTRAKWLRAFAQTPARVGWLTVAAHPGIEGFRDGMRELVGRGQYARSGRSKT
jgi:hypothetical protein